MSTIMVTSHSMVPQPQQITPVAVQPFQPAPQYQPFQQLQPVQQFQTTPSSPVQTRQPQQNTIVIQQNNIRPQNYLCLAIFITLCCNFIFGIIAILFSIMSSQSADQNNMNDARSKGKISLFLSIFGVIVTIIIIIIVASATNYYPSSYTHSYYSDPYYNNYSL
ncbi:hypothetical protein A3Q56_02530 [Intoshia linei]|uniref:Uncharacterized protein n=1 Tax=Intoshia linei TaxID=1819745 RepID=A0A177B603_9BILA|nr:hypothetical protein A3Q56_02530 [Intoshia linei]